MPTSVDFRQVLTLTRFALLSEWRQASPPAVGSFGRKRKVTRTWAIWTVIAYLGTGILLIRIFNGNVTGSAYVTAASLEMLILAFVTASNIFLSFGSGFLSPDEAQMISPMPVSSETFFLSRLAVLLSYTWIISLLFLAGPVVGLPILYGTSPVASLLLLLAGLLSNTAAAMAVIVLYGLVLKKLPKQTLSKTLGYVQFAGSLVTAFAFVILPRIERNLDFASWTVEAKPILRLIPAFWFGSLAGLASTQTTLYLTLAAVSLLFLAVLSSAAHVLLGKNYVTEVGDLALSTAALTKQAKQRRDSVTYRLYMRFARSHEARAVFVLMRAQFRYDAKFRMSLLATLPITVLYLIVAVLSPRGVVDPFVSKWSVVLQAQFVYIFALLMPLMVMQAVGQSENFRAAWIFFALPVDRAKVLLTVRNTLIVSIILPYMTVLAVVLSFFMPVLHAVGHVLVLAGIGGFIFQGYLMAAPKMPFAQPRRPNRTSVATVLGVSCFALVAMLLLGFEIYYGYKTPTRFWMSFALIVTLSILLEQVVRQRIRKRLEREEFEG
jgi:hypothetical protein